MPPNYARTALTLLTALDMRSVRSLARRAPALDLGGVHM
jgi:hypothetical protein